MAHRRMDFRMDSPKAKQMKSVTGLLRGFLLVTVTERRSGIWMGKQREMGKQKGLKMGFCWDSLSVIERAIPMGKPRGRLMEMGKQKAILRLKHWVKERR